MKIWLSFRDIEYVSQIAKLGSISLAADALHISQPALSIYLRKLEGRIGTPLFFRSGKRFILTYAGQCILSGGAEILHIRDGIQTRLDEIVNQDKGLLRVGFPYIRGITLLPTVLKEFKQVHPNTTVTVHEDDAQNLQQKIIDCEIDVAFFNRVLDEPQIEYQRILSDPIVLYISKDDPLVSMAAEREGFPYPWVDFSRCKDLQFISNFPAQKTYQISDRIFDDYGFRPQTVMQVQNQLTAIHLAGVGYGLYLAPAYFSFNISFPPEETPVMLSVGKDRSYNMDFIAAWRRGSDPSKLVKDFVSIARDAYTYRKKNIWNENEGVSGLEEA